MFNINHSQSQFATAHNPYGKECESQLPPQPWTGDISSALSAIDTDLRIAHEAMRHLEGRLFGYVPEPSVQGLSAEKPSSIADDFSERLRVLRGLAGELMSRAQNLNNRI